MSNLISFKQIIPTCLALIGFSVTSSHAALVNYDESVSGDVNGGPSGTPTFLLDTVGTNTWTGSILFSQDGLRVLDLDAFDIALDPSLQITNYSVSWNSWEVTGGITANFDISFFGSTPGTSQIDRLEAPVVDLTSGGPVITQRISMPEGPAITPITDSLLHISIGIGCSGCGFGSIFSMSADYQISAVTSTIPPVPVPAAVWLFGTGILGLIGFSRRASVTTKSFRA